MNQGGLGEAELEEGLSRLVPALASLQARRDPASAALLNLPLHEGDLPAILEAARHIAHRFSNLVVVGAGGSGLGACVLTSFVQTRPPINVSFLDNIDPDAISQILDSIDLARTCFLVVSKSGSTVETLAHFFVLFDCTRQALGENKAAQHFLLITLPDDNPLRKLAHAHNIKTLDHASDIGGRFSVLTNVGLLPAATCGMDVRALRLGAGEVVAALDRAKTPRDVPAAVGAALQYGFMLKGRNISVMLPYAKRLSGFSSWYRQSWAESLGKDGKGTTPIRAVGTTDQHSQLQLYLDGPKDKLFHLIMQKRAGSGQYLSPSYCADIPYLAGKTTGDVMEAQQRATLETLVQRGCPVRVFELETLGEKELGALVAHFTLEIIFMSALLGVNPFDQPAVEHSKQLTRQWLTEGRL